MTNGERVFREFKFRLPSTNRKRLVVTARTVENPRAALQRMLR